MNDNILPKSNYEKLNAKIIAKQIKGNTNFILYGHRGSGKTTFLINLLDQCNKPYIRINCLLGERKITFLKIFWLELRKLLNLQKLNYFNNFQSILKHLNELYLDNPQLFTTFKEGIYCLIDNIQQLKVNDKFLSALMSFADCLKVKFKLKFIFCGIGFSNSLCCYQSPLSDMLVKYFPAPDKEFIEAIIKYNLKVKFENQFQNKRYENFQHFCNILSKNISQRLIIINKDINNTKSISDLLFLKALQIYSEEKNVYKIITLPYYKDYFTKLIEYGPLATEQVDRKIKISNKIQDEYNQKGAFYPSLIQTSIYFAQYCPQNDDCRRFKDYKKTSKRNLDMKKLIHKNKKHNFFRILSIAESLQSQCKENNKQYDLENHSLDYYSCFQYLRQSEKIKFVGKSGAMGIGKIQGRSDEKEALSFLKRNDLKYDQFL